MRHLTYTTLLGLGWLVVACATDGIRDETPPPDAGDRDGGTPVGDAGDAGDRDVVDAERALLCGKSGFCETKLPATSQGEPLSLRSVWVVASDDVWSVSAEGFVLHWDGTRWTTAFQANHELYTIWATATDVWAGGERGLLFHRTEGGDFARVETGHVKAIRGIFGASADDVWFGRDGAVDHWGGTGGGWTSYPLPVAGLQVKALFGRPGSGAAYAVYAEGCASCGADATSRPYVYTLSPGQVSLFNTALSTRWGFFPLSGVVTNVPDAADGGGGGGEGRIFLFGYEKAYYGWNSSYTAFGPTTAPVLPKPLGKLSVQDPNYKEYPPPPILPAWSKQPNDIRVQSGVGTRLRWTGTDFEQQSIDMGYDFVPRTVFAIHGNDTDTWIVGDGFALKGPTQ